MGMLMLMLMLVFMPVFIFLGRGRGLKGEHTSQTITIVWLGYMASCLKL